MPEKVLLDEQDIRRAITRIAHEIVERNRGCEELLLIGIHTRGVPLAKRIAACINDFECAGTNVGALDITLHRDDLSSTEAITPFRHTDIPPDFEEKRVILVDDVLYTGRTVRAAMDALTDFGRSQSIQLVVLVDRGHRELPIRADYVGKNIPTAAHEKVVVRLREIDGSDAVELIRNGDGREYDGAGGGPPPEGVRLGSSE
ncbi:MAG: bifunctional pyr operon transcriptional regulator/uracil phosphoribosyltransferase PyrR [Chloroflexota bacterium]|nr:bifunctional pyr operon transcriptional regulator/uracil phosphoribosyltransferase PyrR [Chloroflexota bacterium]